MKTKTNHKRGRSGIPVIILTKILMLGLAVAQDPAASGKAVVTEPVPVQMPQETEMDIPGSFHHYYGQRVNSWKDNERKLAKLDVDGDMNYDGTIRNDDPADNGAFEQTPPGLVLGTGEMTKLVVRLRPYRVDFQGNAVVTAEVVGINREVRSGKFDSFEDEQAAVGRIRVWRDASKKELILDSGVPSKRVHEWVADNRVFPANLPEVVPRTLYVEGVSPSGRYPGDLRVLFTVSYRDGKERARPADSSSPFYGSGEVNAPYNKILAANKQLPTVNKNGKEAIAGFKRFRTTFDHILFTVRPQPQRKEFINNNAEGVWLRADGKAQ